MVVPDTEVASVERKIDAVDAFQVQVEPRKVGEDRHGGQVHQLDPVVRRLRRHRQNFRRRVELQSRHRRCQVQDDLFGLWRLRGQQVCSAVDKRKFLDFNSGLQLS